MFQEQQKLFTKVQQICDHHVLIPYAQALPMPPLHTEAPPMPLSHTEAVLKYHIKVL